MGRRTKPSALFRAANLAERENCGLELCLAEANLMIDDNNCVCICGHDCWRDIGRQGLRPGDKVTCPACQRLLDIGMGDYAYETGDGEFEVSEYWYVDIAE